MRRSSRQCRTPGINHAAAIYITNLKRAKSKKNAPVAPPGRYVANTSPSGDYRNEMYGSSLLLCLNFLHFLVPAGQLRTTQGRLAYVLVDIVAGA